jgi:hypothetical protein
MPHATRRIGPVWLPQTRAPPGPLAKFSVRTAAIGYAVETVRIWVRSTRKAMHAPLQRPIQLEATQAGIGIVGLGHKAHTYSGLKSGADWQLGDARMAGAVSSEADASRR